MVGYDVIFIGDEPMKSGVYYAVSVKRVPFEAYERKATFNALADAIAWVKRNGKNSAFCVIREMWKV